MQDDLASFGVIGLNLNDDSTTTAGATEAPALTEARRLSLCRTGVKMIWRSKGRKEVIEEFLKFAAGGSPFDFNRFIAYPEEFRRIDEIAEAWLKEHAGRPTTIRARPKDGFNSGGYEWCYANWGTKWPASRVELEGPVTGYDGKTLEVVFHFDTGVEPTVAGRKESGGTLPGATLRTPLLRVRLLFQRALSLQRGAVESNKCGAFRRPRRVRPSVVQPCDFRRMRTETRRPGPEEPRP